VSGERVRPMRGPLQGALRVPGDKSISHRALLFGALADGETRIEGLLNAGDCLATQGCLRALGVGIERMEEGGVTVQGRGLRGGLQASTGPIDCIRSGTAMRLLAGILCGQKFPSTLTGDAQLLRRPMRRVVDPLCQMGAQIEDEEGHAPLRIVGRTLHGAVHHLAVASAQVKSAILLAGLLARGTTTVHQPGPARDHTERMLARMGVEIEFDALSATITPPEQLDPLRIDIPGDFSSAAFPLVAALLVPNSVITLVHVGTNDTRTGLLDVLHEMGARIERMNDRIEAGEPVSDLMVRSSELVGVNIGGDAVVRMIDEFPILAVAATQARGATVVQDAKELRVKESDRIDAIVAELRLLGADIEGRPDGFIVRGPTPLHGGVADSHGDHRLAMALTVAGLIADREVVVRGAPCSSDSYPGFREQLSSLGVQDD